MSRHDVGLGCPEAPPPDLGPELFVTAVRAPTLIRPRRMTRSAHPRRIPVPDRGQPAGPVDPPNGRLHAASTCSGVEGLHRPHGSGEAEVAVGLSWVLPRAKPLAARFAVSWSAYPGACLLTSVIPS